MNFKKMRKLINRLPAARFRIIKAQSIATKITPTLTGMPMGSGVRDKIGDSVILIDEAKKVYQSMRAELEGLRAELMPMLELLDTPLEKMTMEMRYMDGKSVREIAYSLNYSEQHVFRIISRAENKINKKDES